MARSKKSRDVALDPAAAAVAQGWAAVAAHPLFAPMARWRVRLSRSERNDCPPDGWAVVDSAGVIHVHPTRRASAEEWTWVFAHCLLHLGFGHLDAPGQPGQPGQTGQAAPAAPAGGSDVLDAAYAAACDVTVTSFLATLKLGTRPDGTGHGRGHGTGKGAGKSSGKSSGAVQGVAVPVDELPAVRAGSEQDVAARWRASQVPHTARGLGTAGPGGSEAAVDMVRRPVSTWGAVDWQGLFAAGLSDAVSAAVDVAGGRRASLVSAAGTGTVREWDAALSWFVSSFPLLGAVAATLTVVADAALARSWDIAVAAVDAGAGEVYVNPHARLSAEEWRFVLGHEMLHAGLRHGARIGGRDPFLWNVACDYVVNGWLVELAVGQMPDGLLYDATLKGLSAEAVYERITTDVRRARKLATLRGQGLGDVLGEGTGHGPGHGARDLDAFYRSALASGLDLHLSSAGRGHTPSGLVEEIRALQQPAVAWDAQLAAWFEEHVPVAVPQRSYARASRRQSATPDIPRPGRWLPSEPQSRPTFGVVLDTSGSMGRDLLGKALGAVASYATARDVPAVRVVFCDAAAYDAGYLEVDQIAHRVTVRGRGGTQLQPGVDLLMRADDFPDGAPVLVISDGDCDVVRFPGGREHAWLVPARATLPFTPRGPVFRLT